MSLLLAQSRHPDRLGECPLSGAKRTSVGLYRMSAYDPFREAQRWLREATGRAPNHQYGHAFLAATYAQLGRVEDARAEVAEVLPVNPKYTIGTQKLVSILKRAEDSDHLIDGLRKAGLPE